MNTEIFFVIVIYNKVIKDSITLKSLLKSDVSEDHIIIIDNSTSDYGIKYICQMMGYHYLSMGGNAGLSKAYNNALDYLSKISTSKDFVMWLDDDTYVTNDYLQKLSEEIKNNKSDDIFMPVIIGQDGVIYSPNEGAFWRSRFIKSIDDDIDMSKINGINSCLTVRLRVYSKYRYSEDLFLDLIDNQFFDDMRNRNYSFKIIRTLIHQNFFQRSPSANSGYIVNRLNIRIKDFMVYAKKKGKRYLPLAFLKSIGWGIVLGLKFRTYRAITTCFYQSTKCFIIYMF